VASGVVKPIRFPDAELEVAARAAGAAGLKFNAWVRRACREQADLERAIAAQEAEGRNGIERPGWDPPAAVNVTTSRTTTFRPDFGKRLKP
jgi:hypothetical protein